MYIKRIYLCYSIAYLLINLNILTNKCASHDMNSYTHIVTLHMNNHIGSNTSLCCLSYYSAICYSIRYFNEYVINYRIFLDLKVLNVCLYNNFSIFEICFYLRAARTTNLGSRCSKPINPFLRVYFSGRDTARRG